MPVWYEQTREARDAGELILLGRIQEQHPDRCRLFAQWKQFDWPILHDPINLLNLGAVSMFAAIDEDGVVVDSSLRIVELAGFLRRPRGDESTNSISGGTPIAKELDVKADESKRASD